MDLVTVGITHAQFDQLGMDGGGAAHQNRRAISEIAELDRRAQHHLVLALGKDDALGVGLDLFIDAGQHRGRRVEPRFQLMPIGVEIGDRFLRDAAVHRRLGDGRGDDFHQTRVERRRDDIFAAKLLVLAIGGGDFLGHLFTRQFRDGVGGGDLHRLVDLGGADIQRPPENERKAQYIVDLIGIIRSACGDDRIGPHGHRIGRGNFRIGVGHGEDDRVLRHAPDHVLRERARRRQPQRHIRALHRLGQRACRGVDGMGGFELIDVSAALIDHPLGVANRDVAMRHA